jgi:hypothetical protein
LTTSPDAVGRRADQQTFKTVCNLYQLLFGLRQVGSGLDTFLAQFLLGLSPGLLEAAFCFGQSFPGRRQLGLQIDHVAFRTLQQNFCFQPVFARPVSAFQQHFLDAEQIKVHRRLRARRYEVGCDHGDLTALLGDLRHESCLFSLPLRDGAHIELLLFYRQIGIFALQTAEVRRFFSALCIETDQLELEIGATAFKLVAVADCRFRLKAD